MTFRVDTNLRDISDTKGDIKAINRDIESIEKDVSEVKVDIKDIEKGINDMKDLQHEIMIMLQTVINGDSAG